MPEVWDLHFNNLYWQETKTSNGTFYMYGAYLDRRKNLRNRWSCEIHLHLKQLQGDHSGCVKPAIDIKTKVPFYYMRPMY